jgi:hypothetical protein
MEEYKEYRQNMIDLGTSEYNLTEDEVEALLDEKSVLNSIAL